MSCVDELHLGTLAQLRRSIAMGEAALAESAAILEGAMAAFTS